MTGTTLHIEQFPGVESFPFFLMSDRKCLRASMCIIGHVTPQHNSVFTFDLSDVTEEDCEDKFQK